MSASMRSKDASSESVKREEEFGFGHEAGFYSERRSNSTRARAQSAVDLRFEQVERLERPLVAEPLDEAEANRVRRTDRDRN